MILSRAIEFAAGAALAPETLTGWLALLGGWCLVFYGLAIRSTRAELERLQAAVDELSMKRP